MPLQLSDLDFNSVSRILNLPAPASANEPARLADLNSAVEGLAWKDSCRVSTQGNLSLATPGSTIDGITMSTDDRVLVRQQSTGSENGIYIWNGAAVAMTRSADCSTAAELEQAVTTIEEGTDAGTTWRQTLVNFTLGSGSVAWTAFGTSAPSASTSTPGVIAIATQGEVDAGSVSNKAVVPSTLAAWSNRKLKFTANIGDGSATQYDLTHNLGTRDTVVRVYRNSTPWDTIQCDIESNSTNVTRLKFAAAPTSNQFSVVILG